MKTLKPLKFNGNTIQNLGSPISTRRGPSLPAVKVLHPGVDDIVTAGFSIDAGSIPTPNYWARLSGSTAMKVCVSANYFSSYSISSNCEV